MIRYSIYLCSIYQTLNLPDAQSIDRATKNTRLETNFYFQATSMPFGTAIVDPLPLSPLKSVASLKIFGNPSATFFFSQAVEEALRKDRDCPAEKETPKKGKGRGQASEKIRSPLHLTWKRVQARGAKVHACGAQITESACARSCLFLLALSKKRGISEDFGTPEFVKREISNSRVRPARNLQLTTSSEQKYELVSSSLPAQTR